jgi:hypothetical protein
MTRAPVWVKFPNLPLCCWSSSCLSKIASVLGKPIQCDHMTSSLSRLSYTRVLVELDLREDLQHSVAVSLPSGPILNQKVVFEALPKFCNLCNVLGHTRLLYSSAPMPLPALHQQVSFRLWLVTGVFFTAWALRYLPLVCQDTVSLSQFRVLPRIPQLQLLWNLSKLLVMMPLMVGLRWSLGENPRNTSVTPPKGRKCL